MPAIDWTVPSSYLKGAPFFDGLVADAAVRHLHEAFVEVSVLLEEAREFADIQRLQDGIDRSLQAMTAYVCVHDELLQLRRSDRPLRILDVLETVCDAHRGTPGVENGVQFEVAPTAIVAFAEPNAAWAAAVALTEMIRELSRRGHVRVAVRVSAESLTILSTAPAVRMAPALRRSTPTLPFLRQLAVLLNGRLARRRVRAGITLCLVIPTTLMPPKVLGA